MEKLRKWIRANLFNILTLSFAFFALVVSFWSYEVSKQSFEFEQERNSFEITPALTETVDSIFVHFGLNNEKSQLQALQINFPDSFTQDVIRIGTKPIKMNKYRLDFLVEQFLEKEFNVNDSTITVGELALPVIIDYNAIVFGQSYDLRENRILLFTFSLSDNFKEVKFTNSFLRYRCGFPIKKQFHWKWPWKDLENEKIISQDKIDVENILSVQFRQFMETMKK